jgi:hypothetical protein
MRPSNEAQERPSLKSGLEEYETQQRVFVLADGQEEKL